MEALWGILLYEDKNKKLLAAPVRLCRVFLLNLLPALSRFVCLLSNLCSEILCLSLISISPRLWVLNLQSSYHFMQFCPARILCKERKCTFSPQNKLLNSIYVSANYHFQTFISSSFSLVSLLRGRWLFFFFWEDSQIKGIKSTNKRCWKVRWMNSFYRRLCLSFCHILSFSLPSVWEFETWTWSSEIAGQI